MANTYHQIHLHVVFAVKNRKAVIATEWKSKIFGVIGTFINQNKCNTLIVNGVNDHVHCLIALKPVVSVAELLKAVKAKSSKFINDHSLTSERFEWQEGYGVFSYHHSMIDQVYKYIQNQEEHHKTQSFKEEYIQLLKEFKVDYDEQYIFEKLK